MDQDETELAPQDIEHLNIDSLYQDEFLQILQELNIYAMI